MAKDILIDQFHLSLLVSRRLPPERHDGIVALINSRRFDTALRSVIRKAIRSIPALNDIQFTLTR